MSKFTKQQEVELKGQKDKELAYFLKRKMQLMAARKKMRGIEFEDLMKQADRDYELKPLRNRKDTFKGENWRDPDTYVNTATENWQSNNSDAIIFSKIQTALSLLFDRNPGAVLEPGSKRYVANSELAKAIFEDSQIKEGFKDKLKLIVLNCSKYGWGVGRTMIKETERTFEDLVAVNPVTMKKTWKKKTEVKRRLNFKPINNWNAWIDEKATPYDHSSIRDWMYRESYSDEQLLQEFGNNPKTRKSIEMKGGKTSKVVDTGTRKDEEQGEGFEKKNEVFFYENYDKDMVLVINNGIKLYSGKLPAHKELSLVLTFWNLRDDLTVYGIGLPEIMRQDKNLLDKIRNMTIDQLVLSIYKMFFYDGTMDSEDTTIKITPGVGQRVVDPSKLKWLEVPSGGQEAVQREEMLRSNIEESTGISKTLAGSVVTDPDVKALALQQAKEAALAKLKTPLDNILWMLEREATLRWSLIQELNMFPEDVKRLIEPGKIQSYLEEIEFNKELFFFDEEEAAVYAIKYPEIGANVTKADDGVYRPSQERSFFHVTPDTIRWNGHIKFRAESILFTSKELEKKMDLDMANLIIPLFQGPPELHMKPAKQILKIYGKDEEDWLPESWLRPQPPQQPQQPEGVPPEAQGAQAPPGAPQDQGQQIPDLAPDSVSDSLPQLQQLPSVVPSLETEPGAGTSNIVDKNSARNRQA